jgi:hypothetical protein
MAQVPAVTCCGVRSALAPHCARRCPQGHTPAKPALAVSQGWCVVVKVCSSRRRAPEEAQGPERGSGPLDRGFLRPVAGGMPGPMGGRGGPPAARRAAQVPLARGLQHTVHSSLRSDAHQLASWY